VSGKGPAAALYGALISGLLRILAPRRRSPALLMQSLNEALLERKVDAQYATLTVMLWEPRVARFTYCNAGAEPPSVWRGGEVTPLRGTGVPIGLLDSRDYDEAVFDAQPGDTILLHSDGIEDQLNDHGKDFSRTRIQQLFRKHGAETPKQIVDVLFHELDAFRDGATLTDDQSVAVMRIH